MSEGQATPKTDDIDKYNVGGVDYGTFSACRSVPFFCAMRTDMKRIGLIGLVWLLLSAETASQELVPIPSDQVQIYRRYYATPLRNSLFGKYRIGPATKPAALIHTNGLSATEMQRAVQMKPAVCRVSTGSAAGSGALIWQDDRHAIVLTAEHVTGRSGTATCTFPGGQKVSGYIHAVQDTIDVAIIHCHPVPGVTPISVAKRDPPTGSQVLALGYGGNTMPMGKLWAVSRRLVSTHGNDFEVQGRSFISGDSGGPVTHNGQIIGVIRGYGPTTGTGPNTHGIRKALTQWWPEMHSPDCPDCRPGLNPIQRPGRTPIPDLPDVSPQPKPEPPPKPEPVEIDYQKLIDLMVADGRFKGDNGTDGVAGKNGCDGRPGADAVINYDEFVAELPPIYIHKINTITNKTVTEEIHLGEGFTFLMTPHSTEHGE